MASRRASEAGRKLIKQRREELGWLFTDPRWAIAFGKIVQPERDWRELGEIDPYGAISESSMRKFQGGRPIVVQNFNVFCQCLSLDPDLVAESADAINIPEDDFFCGRQTELQQLDRWLINDNNVPFLNIWGASGIGKSSLILYWVKHQKTFSDVVWQTVECEDSEISCKDFVEDVLSRFSRKVEPGKNCFLEFNRLLCEQKILIVLDGNFNNEYLKWFDTNLKKQRYSSSIIVISQSKLDIGISNRNVSKNKEVLGLDTLAIRELWDYHTKDSIVPIACENSLDELRKRYDGNPALLDLVIESIKNNFGGDLYKAMDETTFIPSWAKRTFLDKRFMNLSPEEQQILAAMASAEEDLSLKDIKSLTEQHSLIECLDALRHSSILRIKNSDDEPRYSIPALWRKYLQLYFLRK